MQKFGLDSDRIPQKTTGRRGAKKILKKGLILPRKIAIMCNCMKITKEGGAIYAQHQVL